MMPF
jgi:Nuclear fragile X mental retardation-interacting protein 1 (NUFIP1)